MDDEEIERLSRQLWRELDDAWDTRGADIQDLKELVVTVLHLVEKRTRLAGERKRALAMILVRTMVERRVRDESDRELILAAIEILLPAAIDAIVYANNSGFLNRRCCDFRRALRRFCRCC